MNQMPLEITRHKHRLPRIGRCGHAKKTRISEGDPSAQRYRGQDDTDTRRDQEPRHVFESRGGGGRVVMTMNLGPCGEYGAGGMCQSRRACPRSPPSWRGPWLQRQTPTTEPCEHCATRVNRYGWCTGTGHSSQTEAQIDRGRTADWPRRANDGYVDVKLSAMNLERVRMTRIAYYKRPG
jgi:hypothetical protein